MDGPGLGDPGAECTANPGFDPLHRDVVVAFDACGGGRCGGGGAGAGAGYDCYDGACG